MNAMKMVVSILFISMSTLVSGKVNLNESFFERLRNYQVNAEPVNEARYPWIAKVVHSRRNTYPLLCTASCTHKNLFITTASCIYVLKIKFTRVIYQGQSLSVKVLVVPTVESKQLFDDVGFIITHHNDFHGIWRYINIDTTRRGKPDDDFEWVNSAYFVTQNQEYPVSSVGYAVAKEQQVPRDKDYGLYELNVTVDLNICSKLHSVRNLISGFQVPCYFACSFKEYENKDPKCRNYLGTEGAAVIANYKYQFSNLYFLGVATWGTQCRNKELPVGFSILSSDSFDTDYNCAKLIADDISINAAKGYYDILCQKAKPN